MKNINITKIGFGSFIKLNSIAAFSLGIVLGIIGLMDSIIGGDLVYVTYGNETITGIKAGVYGLFLFPISMTIIFAVFSIFSYLGLIIYFKIRKNIKLKLDFNDIKEEK